MLPDLGVLYADHAAAVWRYARARVPTDADAEDVTSDVFDRAMRSTGSYASDRGTPRAWLLGIARHAAADWWRRQRPEEPRSELPEATAEEDPATDLVRAAGIDEVRRLLGVLSEREREVVALRFGADLPSVEIGRTMGISATAARMLLFRAVTKLRGVLADG